MTSSSEFEYAVLNSKDNHGYKRFAQLTKADGLRELGYGVSDPSMHMSTDGRRQGGTYAHWDPSTALTKSTLKENVLDALPGGIGRRAAGAGGHILLARPSIERVRASHVEQGLVPQH